MSSTAPSPKIEPSTPKAKLAISISRLNALTTLSSIAKAKATIKSSTLGAKTTTTHTQAATSRESKPSAAEQLFQVAQAFHGSIRSTFREAWWSCEANYINYADSSHAMKIFLDMGKHYAERDRILATLGSGWSPEMDLIAIQKLCKDTIDAFSSELWSLRVHSHVTRGGGLDFSSKDDEGKQAGEKVQPWLEDAVSQLSVTTSTFATPILTPTTSVAPAQSLRRSNPPSPGFVEAHFEADPFVQSRKKMTPKMPMRKPSQGSQPSPSSPAQAAKSEADRANTDSLSSAFLRRQINRDREHFNALRNHFLKEFKDVSNPDKCVLYSCASSLHEARITSEIEGCRSWYQRISLTTWKSGMSIHKFDLDCKDSGQHIRRLRGDNKYHLPSCNQFARTKSWGCSELPVRSTFKAV